MEQWMIALLIVVAVTVGMIGQGWVSLLEHQRRKQAMELIKVSLEAGKEPPQQLYDMLDPKGGVTGQPPWIEVVLFSALSVGFWLAYATMVDSSQREAFLVIAATMTVTALGCLALALFRPGRRRDDKR